jgi:hypothetical protein
VRYPWSGETYHRNPNFSGRGELLEQLHTRLTAEHTTAGVPIALHGMGGIGKTQQWLVVFDSAMGPDAVHEFLPDQRTWRHCRHFT